MPTSLRSALYREAREAEFLALARAWLKALRTLGKDRPDAALGLLADPLAQAAAKRFLGPTGARTLSRTAREMRQRLPDAETE